jgi:hypothetical protein
LLYADETIILSETEADMQYALAIFEKYCHHWKLKVNLQKTKVIIFCKDERVIVSKAFEKSKNVQYNDFS